MGAFIGFIIACIIIFMLVLGLIARSKAKPAARQMIADGKITDIKRLNRVMKLLGSMNDIEARDLYEGLKKLQLTT